MRWLALALFLSCAPSTIGPPCTGVCSCQGLNAPVRCPGQWQCNADKLCEYSCSEPCLGDGGCTLASETCTASGFWKTVPPLIDCP